MSFFRITLHRSAIGLPKRTRGVLMALGLRRRSQTVFHPVSAQFAGMILKVKELVRVEEVDRALSNSEVKAERTPDTGFFVERRGNATTTGEQGGLLRRGGVVREAMIMAAEEKKNSDSSRVVL
ncbi:hypothetical protein B0H63DRAFT_448526 [Podospora didyma]|uniref:Large ribosomal subunit protein uL30m n=1 Tax=Podospora didyma TaxID=330526 RepID=A0AAE0U1M8_9PEZI|nr:hypothetical protein B0H63DRAFT_448526 [Podospora didyma]